MVYGYTDNMTVEEQLAFGLKLQNEAHMSGKYTEGAAQKMEARSATMAHTEMAVKMRDDGQNFTISTVLAYQMGLYDEGLLDDVIDAGYALQKQDGSFDKGRALTYEERYWVGEAFGNMGFLLLDYASVNVAIPTQSELKAVEGYVRDDIAYQIDDIYQKQHDSNFTGSVQNMLGQNITRPDLPLNQAEYFISTKINDLNDKIEFIDKYINEAGNPINRGDPASNMAFGDPGISLPNDEIYINKNQKTNTEFLALFLHEYNHQIQYMIANTDLFGFAATGEGKTLFDAAGISDDQMKKISTLSYAGVGKNVVFDQLLFEATWDMPNQEQYTYDLSTNPVSFADFATLESQCQLWEDLLNYYFDKNTNNTSDSFKDANGKPILSNSDISQILLNSGYDSKILRKLK